MKNKLKEEMLEAIFIQTGGRPENPKIAEVCAEIAVKAISSNAVLSNSLPSVDELKLEARKIALQYNKDRNSELILGNLLDFSEWMQTYYEVKKRGNV